MATHTHRKPSFENIVLILVFAGGLFGVYSILVNSGSATEVNDRVVKETTPAKNDAYVDDTYVLD